MARLKGNGPQGYTGPGLLISCIPDSTFEAEIDALITAGTEVVGKLVSLTFGANYEVTSPADGAIPDGIITQYAKSGSSYILTVNLFSYIDQNSNRHTPRVMQNLPTTGTLALQDSVIINGTTYYYVDDGDTGGWGAVIGLNCPTTGFADVLF